MTDRGVFRSIGYSWLSLKTWVKIWLFYVNFIFIVGLAFYGQDPVVPWILIAYASSGPFLLAFMVPQRGLSRLLGLAHIVPWTPLVAYLFTRVGIDSSFGPKVTFSEYPALYVYLMLLLLSVLICLAFDYYDVARWLKGEKYLIGSREAFEKKASMLARDADL